MVTATMFGPQWDSSTHYWYSETPIRPSIMTNPSVPSVISIIYNIASSTKLLPCHVYIHKYIILLFLSHYKVYICHQMNIFTYQHFIFRGGSRDSVDGGLSYGAIFSIIDGTNCSSKAVLCE